MSGNPYGYDIQGKFRRARYRARRRDIDIGDRRRAEGEVCRVGRSRTDDAIDSLHPAAEHLRERRGQRPRSAVAISAPDVGAPGALRNGELQRADHKTGRVDNPLAGRIRTAKRVGGFPTAPDIVQQLATETASARDRDVFEHAVIRVDVDDVEPSIVAQRRIR